MKVQQITAVVKDKYINVYGLGDDQRIYTWNPVKAVWQPYKIEPRQTTGTEGW
jgi:hypothetical protein